MSESEKTIFAKIIDRELPAHILYEDDYVIVILDIFPIEDGHMLFITKEAVPTILDNSAEAMSSLMRTVQKIGPSILRALKADGFNLCVNNGACSGQEIPHTHFHFIPRWNGKERTFDKKEANQDELIEVANRIRREIEA